MKKILHNKITGGWVPISHEMMDHPAFRKLSEAALRVLLFCIRKAYKPHTDRYAVIFKFTYPEAEKRVLLSSSTFGRAIKQLHTLGFIDYFSPGGMRFEQKTPKGYQLSHRWKNWNTPNFEAHDEGHYTSIRC